MRRLLILFLAVFSLNCLAETTFYSDGTVATTFGN